MHESAKAKDARKKMDMIEMEPIDHKFIFFFIVVLSLGFLMFRNLLLSFTCHRRVVPQAFSME